MNPNGIALKGPGNQAMMSAMNPSSYASQDYNMGYAGADELNGIRVNPSDIYEDDFDDSASMAYGQGTYNPVAASVPPSRLPSATSAPIAPISYGGHATSLVPSAEGHRQSVAEGEARQGNQAMMRMAMDNRAQEIHNNGGDAIMMSSVTEDASRKRMEDDIDLALQAIRLAYTTTTERIEPNIDSKFLNLCKNGSFEDFQKYRAQVRFETGRLALVRTHNRVHELRQQFPYQMQKLVPIIDRSIITVEEWTRLLDPVNRNRLDTLLKNDATLQAENLQWCKEMSAILDDYGYFQKLVESGFGVVVQQLFSRVTVAHDLGQRAAKTPMELQAEKLAQRPPGVGTGQPVTDHDSGISRPQVQDNGVPWSTGETAPQRMSLGQNSSGISNGLFAVPSSQSYNARMGTEAFSGTTHNFDELEDDPIDLTSQAIVQSSSRVVEGITSKLNHLGSNNAAEQTHALVVDSGLTTTQIHDLGEGLSVVSVDAQNLARSPEITAVVDTSQLMGRQRSTLGGLVF